MEQDAETSSEAAAKAVLLEECEEQFGLLQKVTPWSCFQTSAQLSD